MEEEETFTMVSQPRTPTHAMPHPSIKHNLCWQRHEFSSVSSEKKKKNYWKDLTKASLLGTETRN